MADDNSGFPLKVLENEIQDKDRDIVRIDLEIMRTLNIAEGAVVNIIGPKNSTNIICLSLHPTDEIKDNMNKNYNKRSKRKTVMVQFMHHTSKGLSAFESNQNIY